MRVLRAPKSNFPRIASRRLVALIMLHALAVLRVHLFKELRRL